MAKFLHIETATKVCSVALSEEGILIDLMEEKSEKYIHSEKLTVFIEEICRRNNWSLNDLDAVGVTSGPGSYTGLRIGVSTAKGLAYSLNIPLIAIDTLYSIASIAKESYRNHTICPMIDARRMEVFSTIFDKDLNILKPLSADCLTKDAYTQYAPFVVCGDGAEKTKALWEERTGITIDNSILSSARGQVSQMNKKYKTEQFEDVAYFEPLYLKDFVATKSKKDLIRGK